MADISRFLQDILDAVYGEEVRGSIHDAIELINDVSEVVLTTGTAINNPTDSSTGFYDGSLYLNTNTFELWKCIGTDVWQSQGSLKGDAGNGIDNITKTSTSGLVDTYTITYTDGTTDTFDITNGEDGDNGNRWYRGTAVSGKAVLPTVYPTGIADANANDFYLNPSEGAIYYCVTGGDDTTATWSYDFTMSGGGGGSVSVLSDLTDVSLTTPSNGQALVFDGAEWVNGNVSNVSDLDDLSDVTITTPLTDQVLKYDGSKWVNGAEKSESLSGLSDTQITAPSSGQLLTFDSVNSRWENKEPDKSFVRYGGSINYADLLTYASTYLTADYEDTFFLLRTGGTIGTGEAAAYWTSNFHDDDVIPQDSHIAVININRGTVNPPVFRYDDFGGYIDISGKADRTELDAWTATAQVQSDNTVTFTGLNDAYGYDLYCENKVVGISEMTKTGSGTSVTLVYKVTGAANGDVCKLRILK